MDTNTHGPPWLRRRHGRKLPPGARASRPHNTGTASPLSSTRLDRQRPHDSASAEPGPFLSAGWPGAASRGNGAAAQRRGCGRDARAPGGAPPPILLASRGGTAPVDAAEPARLVSLLGPSCVSDSGGARISGGPGERIGGVSAGRGQSLGKRRAAPPGFSGKPASRCRQCGG